MGTAAEQRCLRYLNYYPITTGFMYIRSAVIWVPETCIVFNFLRSWGRALGLVVATPANVG